MYCGSCYLDKILHCIVLAGLKFYIEDLQYLASYREPSTLQIMLQLGYLSSAVCSSSYCVKRMMLHLV
ncbi:hypothetical protein chiPu_0019627 [Chiloscyllium punctatum]|uniref:Uncharacterized protein n=1 Tax=Chiloscyllium punctatum TaxID=137246 RepID=A0A401RSP0_CHIPU|nr:hypothetical protein [Chiloscyllium punctatum]